MKYFTFFSFLLLNITSFSQINNEPPFYHSQSFGAGTLSTGKTGTGANMNIVYHRFNWSANPDDATKTLTGNVTTYFKTIATNVSVINFDFNKTSFNNAALIVTYHGTNCIRSFGTGSSSNILNITLPTTIVNIGTLDSVTINYAGIPPVSSGSAVGFQRATDAVGNNYIYTLSESYEDKDWWPCKADMQDKIDSIDINVTVPNAFWVAANGIMIDSADDGTNKVFKFKHRYPIASYLVSLAIAKYKPLYLGNLTVGTKKVPFIVNIFQGKTATEESNILIRMNNNKLVFAALNNLYGNYAFANEKHGYYEFGFGGGMEHQTFSGIGTMQMQSNTTLAHELGHQWWGDKVTFATWNHLWLAEGFATYSEALAFEFVPSIGIDAVTKMASNKSKARANNNTPILINNISNSNAVWTTNNTSAVYERGCLVASMLRTLLGDSKFFAACKAYLNDSLLAYQSATTADMQRHMQTQFGENMTTFFTEWITKKGTPDYIVEWGNVGNLINIKIDQTVVATGTTGTASTFFPMPVVIKIANASGTIDTTIIVYHKAANEIAYAGNGVGATINSNIISYNLSFEPATLTFDPLNRTMANATIAYNTLLPINNIEFKAVKSLTQTMFYTSINTNDNIEKVELEKSENGIGFYLLSKMNLQNKNATTQLYQAFDEKNFNNTTYYRAKVYSTNNIKFSKILVVENSLKTDINIAPNPAKNIVTFNFKNDNNIATTIKIIDVLGKVVCANTTFKNNIVININNCVNGIYFVELIQNKSVVKTEQLVIEK
jgi:Peptidase family M1 domain/Secretion system C-terminal sorting domain